MSKRVKRKPHHTSHGRFSETRWECSDQVKNVRNTFVMDSGGVYMVTVLNRDKAEVPPCMTELEVSGGNGR